jgi:hypothetical protein
MSYLARLKQKKAAEAPRGEATKVSKGAFVPFVAPQSAPSREIAEQWREFEILLLIVGTEYNTPAHEYPQMRQAAANDLPAALMSYRDMANQIKE